jgi:hypothetical protein
VLIFVSAWKLSLQSLFGGVHLTFQSMLKNLGDYQYFLAQVLQVNYTNDISGPSTLFERQSLRPLTSVLTKLDVPTTTLRHYNAVSLGPSWFPAEVRTKYLSDAKKSGSPCTPAQEGASLCWKWGSSVHKTLQMAYVTSVTCLWGSVPTLIVTISGVQSMWLPLLHFTSDRCTGTLGSLFKIL